jgi:prolyl 4-hydroxylase
MRIGGWRICGMVFWLLLVVLLIPVPSAYAALAAPRSRSSGGGFGKPTTTASTNGPEEGSSATKMKKKPRKNRLLLDEDDRSLLMDDPHRRYPSPPSENNNTPLLLDKWGLPPPTLDDIFPLLPDYTKLLPAKADHSYDLGEIHAALQDYIDLDLSRAWEFCSRIALVHESPPVLVIDDFLTPDECREIQQVAGLVAPGGTIEKEDESSCRRGRQFTSSSSSLPPLQIPSATVSPSSLSIRTSTSWFCHYAAVSTLLIKMEHLLGLQLSNIEEPQIVRYQSQQQFSWHYDHLSVDETSSSSQNNNGGQRLATVLVYLNDCIDAPTVFRDLRNSDDDPQQQQPLAVAPVTGRALIFFPAYKDGRPDERTLHRGMPVIDDGREKHLIQCWIHASAYRAALPPNNRQEDVDRVGTRRRLGYE